MRKILLCFFLLIASISAKCQLVLVGGCAANTSSCTPTNVAGKSFATGNFVYTFAYRTAITAPTLPSGYTTLDTASASSSSFRSGCAVMTTSTPPSSTWTNATAVTTLIYSGPKATTTANCVTTGIGGHTSAGTSGTGTTVTYTTVTMTNADASSIVVGAGGDSTTACTPASVLVNQFTATTIKGNDTNGVVSSFASQTCTGSGNWKTDTVEILAAQAATPSASPAGGGYTATQAAPTLTSTGNTVCYFQCTTAGCTATTPTVTTSGTCATGTSIASGSAVSTAINNSGQIKALATKSGFSTSALDTETYTLTVPTPTFSQNGGNFYPTLTVNFSATGAGHFCSTVDGSTPTSASDGSCTAGTLGASTAVSTDATTVKAIGTASNWTNSALATSSVFNTAKWATWNGKTIGSSTGNVSSMNGKTIGTSAGNYTSWNDMAVPSGGQTVAFVQFKIGTNNFGGTTATVAFTSNLVANHNVIACAVWSSDKPSGNTGITISFSDSQGKTYSTDTGTRSTIASTNETELGVECGHSTQLSTATADTVTCTASLTTGMTCLAYEVNPNGGTLTLDKTNTGSGTGSTLTSGTITPAQANTFATAAVMQDDGLGNQTPLAVSGSWTQGGKDGGGNTDSMSEYQNLAGTSAVSVGFTTTTTTSGYVIGIANYKSN